MQSGNINRGGRKLRVRGGRFKNTSGMNRKEKHEFDQNKEIISVKKQLREIKGNTELKYFDSNLDDADLAGGSLTVLNDMATGDTQITRTGGQIKLTSLQFRYRISSNAARLSFTSVRIIVFWDRQANGANPAVAGNPLVAGEHALLNNAMSTDLVEAPYQYENIDRFHVLYDKIIAMNPLTLTGTAGTAVAPVEVVINKYIKLNRTTKYDTVTAGIASINTNALYFLVLTDLATVAPAGNGVARIYFKDA